MPRSCFSHLRNALAKRKRRLRLILAQKNSINRSIGYAIVQVGRSNASNHDTPKSFSDRKLSPSRTPTGDLASAQKKRQSPGCLQLLYLFKLERNLTNRAFLKRGRGSTLVNKAVQTVRKTKHAAVLQRGD